MSEPIVHSYEPVILYLEDPFFHSMIFGVFASFLVLLVLSLTSKKYDSMWFGIAPIIGATIGIIFNYIIGEIIPLLLVALKFPFSFIEGCLYVRLTNYISRWILKQDPSKGKKYQIIVFFVTTTVLSFSSFLLTHGICLKKFSLLHGISLGGLLFSILYSVSSGNGIITDSAFIAFKIALVLSPIIASPNPYITMILRTMVVSLSFVSLWFKYDEKTRGIKAFSLMFSRMKKKQTCISMILLSFSYIVLSPDVFIRPSPLISGLQSVIYPLIFLFFLWIESMYFHVFATPMSQKRQ